jgi:hypothetical protein
MKRFSFDAKKAFYSASETFEIQSTWRISDVALYKRADAYSQNTVLNEARPACVSFISWRFSRVDAMLWISNATAKHQFPDLPFEGYIKSTDTRRERENWREVSRWLTGGYRLLQIILQCSRPVRRWFRQKRRLEAVLERGLC